MLTLDELDHVRVHPPLSRTRGWHGVAAASPSPAPPPPLSLPRPVCHGPRAPALRSPRPRRLLGGGGNTPAVLSGPVSRRRRRRPPHGGTPGTVRPSGGGDPAAPGSGCPSLAVSLRCPAPALLCAARLSLLPALAHSPARPLTLSPAP